MVPEYIKSVTSAPSVQLSQICHNSRLSLKCHLNPLFQEFVTLCRAAVMGQLPVDGVHDSRTDVRNIWKPAEECEEHIERLEMMWNLYNFLYISEILFTKLFKSNIFKYKIKIIECFYGSEDQ